MSTADRPPAYVRLYPSDYLAGVTMMRPEHRRIYPTLLFIQAHEGLIKDSTKTLIAHFLDVPEEQVQEVLEAKFVRVPGPVPGWANRRMDEERFFSMSLREKQSRSGKTPRRVLGDSEESPPGVSGNQNQNHSSTSLPAMPGYDRTSEPPPAPPPDLQAGRQAGQGEKDQEPGDDRTGQPMGRSGGHVAGRQAGEGGEDGDRARRGGAASAPPGDSGGDRAHGPRPAGAGSEPPDVWRQLQAEFPGIDLENEWRQFRRRTGQRPTPARLRGWLRKAQKPLSAPKRRARPPGDRPPPWLLEPPEDPAEPAQAQAELSEFRRRLNEQSAGAGGAEAEPAEEDEPVDDQNRTEDADARADDDG